MDNNNNLVDQYIEAAIRGYSKMEGIPMKPVDVLEIDPLFARSWIEKILKIIDLTKERNLSYREIGILLPNPSAIRVMLGYDLVQASVTGITKEDKLKIFNFYTNILKELTREDPFATHSKNIIHSQVEIEDLLRSTREANPMIARKLGRLISACYNLTYSLYTDNFPQTSYENYGPYKTATGQIMLIREFKNLRPVELWPGIENLRYESIRIVSCYREDIRIKIDTVSHLFTEGDLINGLQRFELKINGQTCGMDEVEFVTVAVEKKAVEMWGELTELSFEELKLKYLFLKSYSLKKLCQGLGIDWRPSETIIDAVRNKKLIKWPEFGDLNKTMKWLKDIIDPRKELSVINKIFIWFILHFCKQKSPPRF